MADTEEPAVTEVTVAMVLPSGKTVVLATGVGATEQVAALPAVLVEGCHTAKYTCFTLEAQDGTPVSELAEIGAYVTGGGGSSSSSSAGGGSGAPTATFVMVPALYDVKKCNVHVARVRDIIQYPPKKLFPGSAAGPLPATPAAADGAAAEPAAVALPAAAVRATPAPAPTVEEVFMDVALERFYKDALLRVGATPSAAVRVPADCIKNIAYSGWHPPPANRRAQGDLGYLEVVTADEGTFQLTATPGGFYVNRSTRTAFDPAPAPHAHYSHELLDTILGLSASCRSAWKALSTHALDDEGRRRDPGALDGIAALYVTGHGSDLATNLKPQWNIAAATNFGGPSNSHGNGLSNGHSAATQRAGDRFAHPYSVARAQAAAADLFGMEEPGTLREWNDEVQATRAMVPTALFEKIQRAHIITKIYTEFADAVKAATVAIVDGLVPSVNAHDEEKLRAYMFNNIFYSRATDSKENFRVCGGTEASRKMAAHDLRNQRLIQAAGVPGLCTVLQCVVDFKGDRLIAQNVIPGMLQQGLHPPRLMYGTVEMGKRLSVKKSALATMQAVCGRFYIPTRTITALPQFEPAGSTPDDSLASDAATSAESRLPAMLGAEEGEVPPVAVLEDEDEEDQPAGSATVRHAGCLEVKLLRGSDGRLYALEAMRVTPRDANYVAGAKGTGHVPAALLAHVDPGVAATYVLRLELVESFVQHRLKALRQEVVHDMVRRRQIEDIEKEEKRRAAGKGGASGAAAMTPEEQEAERRDLDRFQKEMAARAEAITAESLQLELNPNVFLEGFECDVDPAVVQKDEITARRLADFLFTAVTDVVEQVRVGTFSPSDNAATVDGLHTVGINMRYLGRLADLAFKEETEDTSLMRHGRQRLQAMPLFWLEMVEVEVLARCFKHLLTARFQSHPEMKHCPGPTIASMLNHLFSKASHSAVAVVTKGVSELTVDVLADGGDGATGGEGGAGVQSPSRKKKKKKADPDFVLETATVPQLPNVAGQRDAMFDEVRALALSKFGLKEFALVRMNRPTLKRNEIPFGRDGEGNEVTGTNDTTGPPEECEPVVLDDRVSRLMLLRRVCEVCGLRVSSRDYDFKAPEPFDAKDIWGVYPVVKSCEQPVPLDECRVLLANVHHAMERGQIGVAFELLNETSNIQQQVTGPVHKEHLMILGVMAKLLLDAGDAPGALAQTSKCLTLAVQLHGLDSADAYTYHLQLASVYAELLERPATAAQHLLCARYVAELIGGPNHPDVASIYMRLGAVYDDLAERAALDKVAGTAAPQPVADATAATASTDADAVPKRAESPVDEGDGGEATDKKESADWYRQIALRCFIKAKDTLSDIERTASVSTNMAELLSNMGHHNAALTEQRNVLKTFEQLYDDPNHENRVDAKARVERYLRQATIEKVAKAKKLQQQEHEMKGVVGQAKDAKVDEKRTAEGVGKAAVDGGAAQKSGSGKGKS